jgi:predicted kinase
MFFAQSAAPGIPRFRSLETAMTFSRSSGVLILVCGLPGSGKTTYSRQLEARLGALRFCPDEWMSALSFSVWDEGMRNRVEALQWQVAQQSLVLGVTAILEWGTWARQERDRLRLRARELGASVELHYLAASVDLLCERLERRARENPPIRRDQLLQWARAFEVPTAQESALFDRMITVETTEPPR